MHMIQISVSKSSQMIDFTEGEFVCNNNNTCSKQYSIVCIYMKNVVLYFLNLDPLVSLSHTEDLMSLLDADIHSAHPSVIIDADAMFSEDISYFGYPSFRRSSLSRLGSSRGKSPTHL